MLKIFIPDSQTYDEDREEFVSVKATTLQLEHSLLSIKKWESKWHEPFLEKKDKTSEQLIDYIQCMTINQNIDPNVYLFITDEQIKEICDYMEDPMTATWFSSDKEPTSPTNNRIRGRIITAELIYYWMIKLGIPVEFQKWHISQLITLIRVINAEEAPKGKTMSKKELYEKYDRINAANRARFHTRG